jgi:hypothetical protein
MSATVVRIRKRKDGQTFTINFEGRYAIFVFGVVGSFFYARVDRPDLPFNMVMSALAAIHVHLTYQGFLIGKHERYPPCVVDGGIVKNWDRESP